MSNKIKKGEWLGIAIVMSVPIIGLMLILNWSVMLLQAAVSGSEFPTFGPPSYIALAYMVGVCAGWESDERLTKKTKEEPEKWVLPS